MRHKPISSNTSSSILKKIADIGAGQCQYEPAEFISSKTDTKQRLGELFIYTPTKLEMFGLRSQHVSSKLPIYKHTKPLFDVSVQQADITVDSSICQKCNSSIISKLASQILNKQPLTLNSPSLEPAQRKNYINPMQKEIKNHQPNPNRTGLPPIVKSTSVPMPPFDLTSTTINNGSKHNKRDIGRLVFGRLSEGVDLDLIKLINKDVKSLATDTNKTTSSKFSMKKFNLLKIKQKTLSKSFKEQHQRERQSKKSETEMYSQKEQEINRVLLGYRSSQEYYKD